MNWKSESETPPKDSQGARICFEYIPIKLDGFENLARFRAYFAIVTALQELSLFWSLSSRRFFTAFHNVDHGHGENTEHHDDKYAD